ncbi:hypothetical protein H4696_003424 [Amycolatopsis lexingtonensis]|uniref:Uncharacterized protein n=1 Tax=Amycolatopsis lexingtonensis TaxID=218822 RepID=A0ABR9HZG1_9PSEU|nr:hypothetical protein [Amycolatopsis lexingtonensis]MBE1496324.1 hypothetical protein [Amycolatopsis lexingtonensis]
MTNRTAPPPTGTVLRSPTGNHPRIHGVHAATFASDGVLAPACASAQACREIVRATRTRGGARYRATSEAITCKNTPCAAHTSGHHADDTARTDPPTVQV